MNVDLSTLPTPALVALVALAVVQVALQVLALVVLARTPRERMVLDRKWPWVLVSLAGLVGPVVFLAVGRRPAPVEGLAPPTPDGDRVTRTVRALYGEEPQP